MTASLLYATYGAAPVRAALQAATTLGGVYVCLPSVAFAPATAIACVDCGSALTPQGVASMLCKGQL